MEDRVLGPIEAWRDGRGVALGATKQRAALAMLALESTTPCRRPPHRGAVGRGSACAARRRWCRRTSRRLRLASRGRRRERRGEIVTHGRGYELGAGRRYGWTRRGSSAVVTAGRATARGATRRLALWRGPPLSDVADAPFAAAVVRRLEEVRCRALELAFDADLAAGRHADILAALAAATAEHPLSEGLHAQRIVPVPGRPTGGGARGVHDRAPALVELAGVEPGPRLRAVHDAVLRQDPSLDLRATPPQTRGRRRRRPPATSGEARGRRGRASRPRSPAALAGEESCSPPRRAAALLGGGARASSASPRTAPGRLAPDGTLTEQVAVGRAPQAVTAGAGSVWVASPRDGNVTRVDRERDRVVTIDIGGEPADLAFGKARCGSPTRPRGASCRSIRARTVSSRSSRSATSRAR